MITNYLKNEPAAHTSATQRMQDIRQRFSIKALQAFSALINYSLLLTNKLEH